MTDRFVTKNGKRLRCGYTTGACAAAAAGAAARILLRGIRNDPEMDGVWSQKAGLSDPKRDAAPPAWSAPEAGSVPEAGSPVAIGTAGRDCAGDADDTTCSTGSTGTSVAIGTADGDCTESADDTTCSTGSTGVSVAVEVAEGRRDFLEVVVLQCGEDAVRCGVVKDAGDDIDVTDGLMICAEVRLQSGIIRDSGSSEEKSRISIEGGDGVGRVTMPGLDQPPGEAAINSGPRRMIRRAVEEAFEEFGVRADVLVTVTVPEGGAVAGKTMNPELGIQGGISILGTTGIVEPMSRSAIVETIRTEIRVKSTEAGALVLVPGRQGRQAAGRRLQVPQRRIVTCSNYPGEALDACMEYGVRDILIVGNLGKLIKVAGGIFMTHSREADCRLDILIRCGLRAGLQAGLLHGLDRCVTTDAAVRLLREDGSLPQVMEEVIRQAMHYLKRRCRNAEEPVRIGICMTGNDGEILGYSDNMENILEMLRAAGTSEQSPDVPGACSTGEKADRDGASDGLWEPVCLSPETVMPETPGACGKLQTESASTANPGQKIRMTEEMKVEDSVNLPGNANSSSQHRMVYVETGRSADAPEESEPQVWFVGAGCGDPELITLRGDRLLRQADVVIYAGSLVPEILLQNVKPECQIWNSARMDLEQVMHRMLAAVRDGLRVVRLHTGDPSLYGAIREQMDWLDRESVRYAVCPGVSSFSGAAAALRAEYTLPGVSQTLILTRMEGRTPVPERERIRLLATHGASMAVFLSASMTERLQEELLASGGYHDGTPCAVVYKASWPEEKILRTVLGSLHQDMQNSGITKTALILVGDFLQAEGERSRLYDPEFSTEFRRGKKEGDRSTNTAAEAGQHIAAPVAGQPGNLSEEVDREAAAPAAGQAGYQWPEACPTETGRDVAVPATGQAGYQWPEACPTEAGRDVAAPATGQAGYRWPEAHSTEVGRDAAAPAAGQAGYRRPEAHSTEVDRDLAVPAAGQAGYQWPEACPTTAGRRVRRVAVVSYTAAGAVLAERLQAADPDFRSYTFAKDFQSTGALLETLFDKVDGILFFAASGIAVRSIAPFLRDKRTDPAILAGDDQGRFVISLVSGHIGGANALTRRVAERIGAQPVITTASDGRGCGVSVDTWAEEHGFRMKPPEHAKAVTAAWLRGDPLQISVIQDGYRIREAGSGTETGQSDPEGETKAEDAGGSAAGSMRHELILRPKPFVLGIGCRRGTPAEVIRTFVSGILEREGIAKEDIWRICSIDRKADEEGICDLAAEWHVEYRVYSAEELRTAQGRFRASEFVETVTGVDNVCERSAVLGSGNGELVIPKTAQHGVTLAVSRRTRYPEPDFFFLSGGTHEHRTV